MKTRDADGVSVPPLCCHAALMCHPLLVQMFDPHTPLGAHGIGEIGITGVAAAIANAVHHATGKRVTDLPITLDKLM